jgi:hypothetical protein
MSAASARRGGRLGLLALAAGQLALSGCDRPEPPTAPVAEPSIANLVVSGSSNTIGGVIVVTAAITAAAQPARVGGYTLRLTYDTTRIAFLEEETVPAGLGAVHAEGGVVRAAGASISGFPDGVLVRAAFQVRRAGAPGGLLLVIDELNGIDLADRRPPSPARLSVQLRP